MRNVILILFTVAAATSLLPATAARAGDIAQGHSYFLHYCASCHGTNGDGRGPAARALKVQPPDLRRLTERYGAPLPTARLMQFIYGPGMLAAHGSREMPVWGNQFAEVWTAHQSGQNLRSRVREIILYLDSIQLAGHPVEGAAPAAPTP
jgi:mono/diheme cytochrome c family protein